MRICDACKRKDIEIDPDEPKIQPVVIGTSIGVMKLGDEIPSSTEVDLCSDCIRLVNDEIWRHLRVKFGLNVRGVA